MKKVLLLGAMGFIGKNIIHSLSDKYDILAYDRIEDLPNEYGNLNYVCGDFKTEDRWAELLQGIDTVVHLISTTNVSSGTENIENEICENVIPTVRLLETMKTIGVERMVFLSSGGTIYGQGKEAANTETSLADPICPYGVQKLTIESYLRLYNELYDMKNLVLRAGNPYGIGQAEGRLQGIIPIYLKCFLEQTPITVYGDGENVRDYIFMSDFMEAVRQALDYDGDQCLFNIGSGEGHSINDIIQLIGQETGYSCPEIRYEPGRKVDVRRNVLNSSLFQKETGWEIKTDLRQGISQLYHMMEKQ